MGQSEWRPSHLLMEQVPLLNNKQESLPLTKAMLQHHSKVFLFDKARGTLHPLHKATHRLCNKDLVLHLSKAFLHQTVQVTVQGNVAQTGLLRFNQNPMTTTCPFCQAHITTATSSRSGGAVWLTCLGITFLTGGFCFPCAFIPFCIDDMKDQVHSSPNCGKVVGTYSKL